MPEISDAALRCALALIHLSWRFDPKEGGWIDAEEDVSRRDVQEACGLSDEGTRQGLSELEDKQWAEVDRSGRSYRYQLVLDVPRAQYTYLPTTLLEKAREFDSTTALRVLLTIFRQTWGWTREETSEDTSSQRVHCQMVHRRWARLSTSDLARRTGRSETAVKKAVGTLVGETVQRARPDRGAHLYRIRPEPFGPGAIEDTPNQEDAPNASPSNEGTPNDLPPDRQRSGPPTSFRESRERNKQRQDPETTAESAEAVPSEVGKDAVPGNPPSENRSQETQNSGTSGGEEEIRDTGVEDLPQKKRSLAQKLINAGVWPERARECLGRYSERRIEANFELYRERAPEIDDDGAWLCAAITDGYADLPSSGGRAEDRSSRASAGPLPPLQHKETVSEAEKDAYLAQGVGEDRFHQCPPRQGSTEPRFMYFDPDVGGPKQRSSPSREGPIKRG